MLFLNNKGPAKGSFSTCASWKQLVDASTTHKPIIDESLSKGRSVTENIIDASELEVTISPSIIVPFVITAQTSRITTCSRRGLSLSCSSQQMQLFWSTYNCPDVWVSIPCPWSQSLCVFFPADQVSLFAPPQAHDIPVIQVIKPLIN